MPRWSSTPTTPIRPGHAPERSIWLQRTGCLKHLGERSHDRLRAFAEEPNRKRDPLASRIYAAIFGLGKLAAGEVMLKAGYMARAYIIGEQEQGAAGEWLDLEGEGRGAGEAREVEDEEEEEGGGGVGEIEGDRQERRGWRGKEEHRRLERITRGRRGEE